MWRYDPKETEQLDRQVAHTDTHTHSRSTTVLARWRDQSLCALITGKGSIYGATVKSINTPTITIKRIIIVPIPVPVPISNIVIIVTIATSLKSGGSVRNFNVPLTLSRISQSHNESEKKRLFFFYSIFEYFLRVLTLLSLGLVGWKLTRLDSVSSTVATD